jgi:hypothetical protein
MNELVAKNPDKDISSARTAEVDWIAADGAGQQANPNASRTIPVSRPSACPASDSWAPSISQPNSDGLRMSMRLVAAASTAATTTIHLTAFAPFASGSTSFKNRDAVYRGRL